MRKRRRRIKKKVKIVAIFLIIILIMLFTWPYLFVNIKLYGDKSMTLDYGEKYSEPGYKARMFGNNITKKVKIDSNVADKLGKYRIIYKYKYKFALIPVIRIRQVYREDITGPKIELLEGDNFEVTINTEYVEPGYKAIDNLDGDVTSKVKVEGTVDVKTLGDYELTYTVKDKTGNVSKKVRTVKVEKLRPTQMSLKEFTLDGWYDEVKLKETSSKGENYYNSLKMIGDSNTMIMYNYGYIKAGNAWAVPCLHAESMFTTKLNIYGTGEATLLLDAVKKYKPAKIILNFGTFSTAWISQETFMKNANNLLDKIKELSPDTKIALISIFPIDSDESININKFSQKKINDYNFYLLEMAKEHKIKFIDVSGVLKGNDGYAAKKYISDDGYHLSYLGYSKVKEYIMTHPFEE